MDHLEIFAHLAELLPVSTRAYRTREQRHSDHALELLPQRAEPLDSIRTRGRQQFTDLKKNSHRTAPRLFCGAFSLQAAIWEQAVGGSLWTGKTGCKARLLPAYQSNGIYVLNHHVFKSAMELITQGDPGEKNDYNNLFCVPWGVFFNNLLGQ